MKVLILLVFVAFISSGCATAIPYNHNEQCALKGMKLSEVGYISDSSSATAWNPNIGTTIISSRGYSESVSCEMPQNSIEKCEISRIQQISIPKVQYNTNISSKKVITGIGYAIYIVPGIVAKIAYDKQKDEALNESYNLERETADLCSGKHIPISFNE